MRQFYKKIAIFFIIMLYSSLFSIMTTQILPVVNMHYWREQLCRSYFGNFIIKYASHSRRPVTERVHEIIEHVTDTSVAVISPRN